MFSLTRKDTRPSVDIPFYGSYNQYIDELMSAQHISRTTSLSIDKLSRTVLFSAPSEQNWVTFVQDTVLQEEFVAPQLAYNEEHGIVSEILSKQIS